MPGSSFVENVAFAWNRVNMGRLLLNTMYISISVALGKIILSIIGAFAFVYFDFRFKAFFFVMILITHMLPLPVRIVPTFELIDQLGWINTFNGLTIPFFASATGILLFRQLYQTIPPSLADAARIDGAGPLQFLWSIVLPISRTNIAALFLIEFIYMWNQYLWPLIIANSDRTPCCADRPEAVGGHGRRRQLALCIGRHVACRHTAVDRAGHPAEEPVGGDVAFRGEIGSGKPPPRRPGHYRINTQFRRIPLTRPCRKDTIPS